MNIFILEDNLIQQTRIKTLVAEILREDGVSTRQFEVFSKSQNLLDAIVEKGNHQLFLLDIEIKGEEKRGLETAADIRQIDPNAIIVFVTTHSEFAPISFKYKVSALDFIDKTAPDEQFKADLREVIAYTANNMHRSEEVDEVFTFESAQARVQLPFKDIYYFATSPTPHKVMLITRNERLEFYGSLSEIVEVNSKLFSCHRSFLINLDNISRVDKANLLVYFENGDFCPVSRLKMKALMKEWEARQGKT
ncbi:response regulator transcription factor [Streptococcus sobrinus]|uniref:response regulator transcription factor n=1 Tax=Streptococcus sobrinus TaxID=1310 RepID=UPI0002DC864D|nr:LytTR family DNA-binding domain-containing protein [Streptococcus sobrinus]